MALLLVGVHGAAEGEDGVVAVRVGGRLRRLRRQPLVELDTVLSDRLGEDAGAGVALVDYRQDPHGSQVCHCLG